MREPLPSVAALPCCVPWRYEWQSVGDSDGLLLLTQSHTGTLSARCFVPAEAHHRLLIGIT